MTAIEVMRKALEAMEHPQAGLVPHQGEWRSRTSLAIDALRAELERLEAVEPVAWIDPMALDRIKSLEPGSVIMTSISGTCERPWVRPIYTAPVAPAIPALTDEEVEAGSKPYIQSLGGGHWYSGEDGIKDDSDLEAFASWAYAQAAERAGVQIKDTLQELADDAKQIGLEYGE
ncbi:MAG: hypothetical protein RJA63_3086 [Pseudomonadota bacterium]